MDEETVSYSELLEIIERLEKSLMQIEPAKKISLKGNPVEFSNNSIVTKSYTDMLNEIKKIEKIIAAVQYDLDLINAVEQEPAKSQSGQQMQEQQFEGTQEAAAQASEPQEEAYVQESVSPPMQETSVEQEQSAGTESAGETGQIDFNAADNEGVQEVEEVPKVILDSLNELENTLNARFYDDRLTLKNEMPIGKMLKSIAKSKAYAIVFDGVITQGLVDLAEARGIRIIAGVKTGDITRKPDSLMIVTKP